MIERTRIPVTNVEFLTLGCWILRWIPSFSSSPSVSDQTTGSGPSDGLSSCEPASRRSEEETTSLSPRDGDKIKTEESLEAKKNVEKRTDKTKRGQIKILTQQQPTNTKPGLDSTQCSLRLRPLELSSCSELNTPPRI